MRVAIVGCGLIGGKRARTLGSHPLVVASDVHRFGKLVHRASLETAAAGCPKIVTRLSVFTQAWSSIACFDGNQ